jgi:hypothetical protein
MQPCYAANRDVQQAIGRRDELVGQQSARSVTRTAARRRVECRRRGSRSLVY